ncbi:unnamed protein product [Mytilus coruscus]|uniref:Uncharacterized protein n=1 Tax=Mytilus coruscus TaxID=42192 RepID=A0A6J8A2Z2_MYTCO|nr:unnamed protein product [Mytilus coruscus]
MEEIECLDADMFVMWIEETRLVDFDEGLRIINENTFNGHIFMYLTGRDLKDLFPDFMTRKRIRDLQITEQNTETAISVRPPGRNLPPQKAESPASTSRNSPLLRVMAKCSNSNTKSSDEDVHIVTIPLCGILANHSEHTDNEVDTARVKLICHCMDSLISLCGDRPNELDIIHLARSLASQYSIIRDDPTKPAGNNICNFIDHWVL